MMNEHDDAPDMAPIETTAKAEEPMTDEKLEGGLDKLSEYPEEKLSELFSGEEPDLTAVKQLFASVKATPNKSIRLAKFKEKFPSLGDATMAAVKKIMFPLLLLALIPFMASAESWPTKFWADLEANSSLNLGNNFAPGALYDFLNEEHLVGGKTSIYNYRMIHFEYGLTQRTQGEVPVTHVLGVSLYVNPFLNWAKVPEKWIAIKRLFVGPWVGYDFETWRAGIQIHLKFLLEPTAEVGLGTTVQPE